MANLPITEFGPKYNITKTGDKAVNNIWEAFKKSNQLQINPTPEQIQSAIAGEKAKDSINKTNLTEEQIRYKGFVESYSKNLTSIEAVKNSVSSDVSHLKQAQANWNSVEETFNKYNLTIAQEFDLQAAEPTINYSNIALVVVKAYGTLSKNEINVALNEIAKSLGNYNLISNQYASAKKEFERIKTSTPGAPKPPVKPKADPKTPPQRPKGAAKSSSSAASTSEGSNSNTAATPTVQTAQAANQEATPTPDPQAEAENQFKMSLRGIVDSDQCKISRMYNYFEKYFFETKFPTHPHYSSLAAATPSKQYQLFEYIPPNKKQAGINPSILSRVKKEEMHLWYLRNDIVSLLTKNISIYKVYREKVNGRFTGNFTNIVDLQIPHYLGEGLAYRTDDATKPSLDAVLNSFNWNYIGTDSFTAERDIEATMQITLQNMDALFAIRENSANQKYRLSDLLIQPDCFKNNEPVDPQTPSGAQQRTTRIEDDPRLPWIAECYEVMVSVGHDMPRRILDQKKLEGDSWTDPRLGNIRFEEGAFDKLKTTLFLTLVDHKINFSSNGKVQLDITYRARLGSNMRSDVLDVNGPAGQISDEQTQELKKILGYGEGQNNGVLSGVVDESANVIAEDSLLRPFFVGVQEVASRVGIGDGPRFDFGNVEDIGVVYRRLEELKLNYQGIESKKKVLVRIDNGLSYLRKIGTKKFFRKVLAHLLVTNRVEILRLNNAVETKKYIQSPTKENLINSVNELKRLMETPIEIPPDTAVPQGTTGVPSSGGSAAVQTVDNTNDQRSIRQASDAEGVGQVGSERDDANRAENNGSVTSEPKDISFVFFYDLLSAVIEVLLEKDKTGQAKELLKTFFIVHTNILMPDIDAQFSSDRSSWKPFNIAATPIALSTLNNFVANVAEQGKEKYPLFAVIRDMVNQLLADALGSECVDQYSSPTFIQKFLQLNDYSGDVNKINNHYSREIGDTVIGQEIGTGHGGFINAATLAKSFKDYYPIASVAASVRSGNFIRPTELLVISFENTIYREVATGRFETDNRNGIPHIKFKDQRGLIVELSLSKTDQPYLREARYTENSGFSLLQLSNVYDANIKMKGNNLCMLGGLIYFDPTTLGNSLGIPTDDSSLSYIMGIGGLYVVTKIEHSFSIDGYITSVQARYISRGAT